eukprot:TRINITY_DN378_c0_g1_i1.p1 TRINITY_DN378_c0_g1~~TRINITY_DN378_c0_g1_i1.p1  ORF type:complete len:320 (+),score=49.64 TRINITY_DN378_c0_g1_i1:55-960(+)
MDAMQHLNQPAGGYDDQPQKKRSKTSRACLRCKATKSACSAERPCQRCVKLHVADTCVSADQQRRGPKPKLLSALIIGNAQRGTRNAVDNTGSSNAETNIPHLTVSGPTSGFSCVGLLPPKEITSSVGGNDALSTGDCKPEQTSRSATDQPIMAQPIQAAQRAVQKAAHAAEAALTAPRREQLGAPPQPSAIAQQPPAERVPLKSPEAAATQAPPSPQRKQRKRVRTSDVSDENTANEQWEMMSNLLEAADSRSREVISVMNRTANSVERLEARLAGLERVVEAGFAALLARLPGPLSPRQ